MKLADDGSVLVSLTEAGVMLGLTKERVRQLVAKGKLADMGRSGCCRYVRESDVMAMEGSRAWAREVRAALAVSRAGACFDAAWRELAAAGLREPVGCEEYQQARKAFFPEEPNPGLTMVPGDPHIHTNKAS